MTSKLIPIVAALSLSFAGRVFAADSIPSRTECIQAEPVDLGVDGSAGPMDVARSIVLAPDTDLGAEGKAERMAPAPSGPVCTVPVLSNDVA